MMSRSSLACQVSRVSVLVAHVLLRFLVGRKSIEVEFSWIFVDTTETIEQAA
jgi:hypothetical protein